MSDSERAIRAGDHLWVQRLGYEHHGLASGPHTVIQYSGKDGFFDTGVIEEVALSTFAKDRKIRFVEHPTRLHSRTESVRRGWERIGETDYNLVFNNCEHFVMWCIEDEHTSAQVNRKVKEAGRVATAAAMYRWYMTWTTEEAVAGPTVRAAVQLVQAGRTASTVANAATAARVAVSLAPTVSAALTTTPPAAASSIASGLSAAGLTTVVGGAGATALGIVSAPMSVPVLVAAAGVGLAVTAVSALWDSIFD